jgi:hypothetical protein
MISQRRLRRCCMDLPPAAYDFKKKTELADMPTQTVQPTLRHRPQARSGHPGS